MLDSSLHLEPHRLAARLESYKRLADVFHHVLSEQSLDALLDRIADTLKDLLDYDTLIVYEADEPNRLLIPVLARDQYAQEIMQSESSFGGGITGWAVEHREPVLANQAHLDPRVEVIPGTPLDPESFLAIPLIARGSLKGALAVYRQGEDVSFEQEEFELAIRFGEAAALALDNAHRRAELELQAQTDSLTSLYNHRHFHERLRSELSRASRTRDSLGLLIIDIDDFKRVNDVYGHVVGDAVLVSIADLLRGTVRGSDVVCRLGGEEFAVILPSCDAGDALGLATRLQEKLSATDFDTAGRITVSIGVAQGPDHAANPRELVACGEAAMMTAKARGKNRIVLFEEDDIERPNSSSSGRDVRSIAHLKMLQSLAGKLNRLNDVRQIGQAIANELRTLIDYHSCRVHIVEGRDLIPIAFKGNAHDDPGQNLAAWTVRVGEGITGHVVKTGRSLLVPNALECEWALQVPGTFEIEESVVAVPLTLGTRVIGVVVISKLGRDQFDDDDVRLLEVLGGHASVALENARLYEHQRLDAENARALLKFADVASDAPSVYAIANESVRTAVRLLEATQSSLWLQDERSGEIVCTAHHGYIGDPTAEMIVRHRLTEAEGLAVLEGHNQPFVAMPEEMVKLIRPAPDSVPRPNAIAPLHGLVGFIIVRSPAPHEANFTDAQLRLLANLSYQASTAMQKTLAYRDQKESAEIANALLDFSRELARSEDIDEVLARTVELSARALGSPRASVWIEEIEGGDLVAKAQFGFPVSMVEQVDMLRFPAAALRGLLGVDEPFVIRPAEIEQVVGDPDVPFQDEPAAVAPFRLEGGRLGALVMGAPALGDYEFSDRKMKLLSGLAHQARLAIGNAASFNRQIERACRRLREGGAGFDPETVESLVRVLKADPDSTSRD
ncbi:MAG: diguanylate cyclase [Actinomycetota bacterium]